MKMSPRIRRLESNAPTPAPLPVWARVVGSLTDAEVRELAALPEAERRAALRERMEAVR